MRTSISILAAVAALALADQAVVDDLAANLNAMYKVVDGFPVKPNCGVDADSGLCFSSAIHLKYSGAANQNDMSWELYVPFPHRILRIDSPDFAVEHVTGAWPLASAMSRECWCLSCMLDDTCSIASVW